jgi:hypothetical protein
MRAAVRVAVLTSDSKRKEPILPLGQKYWNANLTQISEKRKRTPCGVRFYDETAVQYSSWSRYLQIA